jgi:hypothetical protein
MVLYFTCIAVFCLLYEFLELKRLHATLAITAYHSHFLVLVGKINIFLLEKLIMELDNHYDITDVDILTYSTIKKRLTWKHPRIQSHLGHCIFRRYICTLLNNPWWSELEISLG